MMVTSTLLVAFTLVGTDKVANVVVPDVPEQSSVLAATELTNYVARITGARLAVETWNGGGIEEWRLGDPGKWKGERASCRIAAPRKATQPTVFIGTLETLGDYAPAVAKAALGKAKQNEAAWTGMVGGNLWIVGKEDVAELYAAYRLIEQKLGVRWFKAATEDDPGDYVPTAKTIVLDDFAECAGPDFLHRSLDMCSAVWNVIPRPGLEMAYRLGYQTKCVTDYYDGSHWWRPAQRADFREVYGPRISRRKFCARGGHTMFTETFPQTTAFEKHPEYFAFRNGARQRFGCMYCLSNEELVDRTADLTIKLLRRHQGRGTYLFGQADFANGWCTCEKCQAMEGPDFDPEHPNISTRMAKIANRMAARIWMECPEAELSLWAYSSYRQLPKGVTFDPRLACYFCIHGRCYGHRIDDPNCPRNRDVLKLMLEWQKLIPQVYTYEYFTCTPPLYICHEMDEAHDVKAYKRLGLVGWKNEAYFAGSKFVGEGGKPDSDISNVYPSNWQWAYVTGHLLWNAGQDPVALLRDAETKYYGAAAEPMLKYHALRRELWSSRRECTGYPQGDPRRPLLLNAGGAKEKLFGYLDEADKLAGDDKIVASRLALDRKWLTRYWIKPNEKAREKDGRTLIVPKTSEKIIIDGDPSDAGWLQALDVCDRFKDLKSGKPVPAELTTRVGVVTDGDSLYFLVQAKEPDLKGLVTKVTKHDDANCFGDDSFEILLYPPHVENSYNHLCITANGVVYDSQCPGEDTSCELNPEVKTGRDAEGWFAEIRVPSKGVHPIADGDKWRIQLVRNRRAGGGKGLCFSLDGESPLQPGEFPTFELGAACIKNGTFDHLGADGTPTHWAKTAGEVRKIGNNNVLFATNVLNQLLFQGPKGGMLPQVDHDRKLSFSFRAAGKGKVRVSFVRYSYPPDGDWRKRTMPTPHGDGGTYALTDEMKLFSGSYVLKANECVGLYFYPPKDGCLIDDITLSAGKL